MAIKYLLFSLAHTRKSNLYLAETGCNYISQSKSPTCSYKMQTNQLKWSNQQTVKMQSKAGIKMCARQVYLRKINRKANMKQSNKSQLKEYNVNPNIQGLHTLKKSFYGLLNIFLQPTFHHEYMINTTAEVLGFQLSPVEPCAGRLYIHLCENIHKHSSQ